MYFLFNLLLLGIWFSFFLPLFSYNYLRLFTLFFFSFLFLSFFFLGLLLNEGLLWYQLFIEYQRYLLPNFSYIFAIDSFSLAFVILCCFLLLLCFLAFWELKYQMNFYSFLMLFSLWILCNVFTSSDLFVFYIFFEAILIPMFLFVTIWGSRSRKVYAAYQLFIYTLLGSIFTLLAFLSIYLNKGSSLLDFALLGHYFEHRQILLWTFLFLGFSVKVPVVPLHLWLPEAHVEAPTVGSVILAGIILKLGAYAMLRFLFSSFSVIVLDVLLLVMILAFLGFAHASLVAFNQIDIKKIIAYSSISHMNFSLLGLFCLHLLGLTGAFVMLLGHALTASALFLGIGVLYDRYKTRLIFYYSSMALFMPLFSSIYFCFVLANFGFPGTVNFVGEFLLISGAFSFSNFLLLLSTFGLVLTLIYSLFFFNRVFFGPLISSLFLRYYSDYTRREIFIHAILLFFVLWWGLYPKILWAYPFAKLFQLNFYLI